MLIKVLMWGELSLFRNAWEFLLLVSLIWWLFFIEERYYWSLSRRLFQEEASEISKIKQSLFDDLKHFGAKEESAGEGYFS